MRPPSPNSVSTDWTSAAISRAVSSSFSKRPRTTTSLSICSSDPYLRYASGNTTVSRAAAPVLEGDHRHGVALPCLECPYTADDAGDRDRCATRVEFFDPLHTGRLQLLRMPVNRVPAQVEPQGLLLETELFCLCPWGRGWEGNGAIGGFVWIGFAEQLVLTSVSIALSPGAVLDRTARRRQQPRPSFGDRHQRCGLQQRIECPGLDQALKHAPVDQPQVDLFRRAG